MSISMRRVLLWAGPLVLLRAVSVQAAESPTDELARVKSELASTRSELGTTRAELAATRDALQQLTARVDSIAASAAPAAPAPSGPRIPPVNADNPGVSFVVDTTGSYDRQQTGYDFALQSGELFLSAPVDPFLRAFATINGSSGSGFDIEEAAVVTTSLPWNLTVEGGRFFADVGRLPHWHDEALPFVDRPPSIDRLIGGESQAEGVQVTWLAPTEHYISLTTGLFNTIGALSNDQLRATGYPGLRSFDELTWLVHPSTYFDLTDSLNLEIGATAFGVGQNARRGFYGFDATLRHQPGTSGFYQGLTLGTEWYWDSARASDAALGIDPATGTALFGPHRYTRNGGYAYLETYFNRRFSFGVRGDYAQYPIGPADPQWTWSAFATWFPSEFQRLRLQFDDFQRRHEPDDERVTLQWTAFMGSHSHGFTTR